MLSVSRFLIVAMILSIAFLADQVSAAEGNERVIFLHHSTGRNLYNAGVPARFAEYNEEHGTSFAISEVNYPTNGYPWNNYPYDYWNLWVTVDGESNERQPACQPGNPNMECLDGLASQYNVIVFKHCYPGADVGAESTPSVSSARKTVENYKRQYRALRAEFAKYPNTIFIAWTLVPRRESATNEANAARAREFVDWVRDEWLTEVEGETYPNIRIFDYWGHATGDDNYLRDEYENGSSDSHPNALANSEIHGPFSQAIIDHLNSFNVEPDNEPPSVPTGLTAQAVSELEIRLQWQESTDNQVMAGYIVYRDGQEISRPRSNELLYNDGGLQVETSYSYTIASRDMAGNISAHAETVMATTLPAGSTPIEIPVVELGDLWRYFPGTVEPPASWRDLDFNDTSWLAGPSGFGYGDNDDATVLDMAGNYVSLYCRKSFTGNFAVASAMVLTIDYDDGFVAYLNGVEIARANVSGEPGFSEPASEGHEAGTPVVYDLADHLDLINKGENILAVQGRNGAISSSDFSLAPSLIITGIVEPAFVADSDDDQDVDGYDLWNQSRQGINAEDLVLLAAGYGL